MWPTPEGGGTRPADASLAAAAREASPRPSSSRQTSPTGSARRSRWRAFSGSSYSKRANLADTKRRRRWGLTLRSTLAKLTSGVVKKSTISASKAMKADPASDRVGQPASEPAKNASARSERKAASRQQSAKADVVAATDAVASAGAPANPAPNLRPTASMLSHRASQGGAAAATLPAAPHLTVPDSQPKAARSGGKRAKLADGASLKKRRRAADAAVDSLCATCANPPPGPRPPPAAAAPSKPSVAAPSKPVAAAPKPLQATRSSPRLGAASAPPSDLKPQQPPELDSLPLAAQKPPRPASTSMLSPRPANPAPNLRPTASMLSHRASHGGAAVERGEVGSAPPKAVARPTKDAAPNLRPTASMLSHRANKGGAQPAQPSQTSPRAPASGSAAMQPVRGAPASPRLAARSAALPPASALPSASAKASAKASAERCDRCDGPHPSAVCPHYKKSRGNHPDEQKGSGLRGLGAPSRKLLLRRGRVASQPGDGSCLFHSLRHGLLQLDGRGGKVPSSQGLRAELAGWIARNANTKLAETPLSLWVKWDSGLSTREYASRMSRRGWGGGIEMAACSHVMACSVWVYEERRSGSGRAFERISAFDAPGGRGGDKGRVIHVLYRGSCHYDAYQPEGAELSEALSRAAAHGQRSASAPPARHSSALAQAHGRGQGHTPQPRQPLHSPIFKRGGGNSPGHSGGRRSGGAYGGGRGGGGGRRHGGGGGQWRR